MQILINNIKMPLEHKIEDVLLAAQKAVRQHFVSAKNFSVYKQSIDARRKSNIRYVYSVMAEIPDGSETLGIKNITAAADSGVHISKRALKQRPVVVGMGPAGLFAAYVLTLSGNPPIIIERGAGIEERQRAVKLFWETGALDPNSNVQFGEGGAGTFSDGKLNTSIKDKRQRFILETFVKFGAPPEILYKAKPHIGTDILRDVIVNMRKYLKECGCEIRFKTCMTDVKIRNGRIEEIELSSGGALKSGCVFLAIGHSSRDTYKVLESRGCVLKQKPFAMGVRIEHRQQMIGMAQYGDAWSMLPAADYKLTYNGKERSCYSFCMCPGGYVVNASSEPGMLAVNGMSNHDRGGENANSALVVNVRPEDFGSGHPLAGIELQRKYERLAFEAGRGGYAAPVQLARDFVIGRASDSPGDVSPSYTGKITLADLRGCLPEFVSETLCDGLKYFDNKISGFLGSGLLTGIETRTSAPVRIVRNDDFSAAGVMGLYPIGEGAGYAGGIVSAALDGLKAALSVTEPL